MAINAAVRKMLKALSESDGIEVDASRHFANIKGKDPLRKFKNAFDYIVECDTGAIPTRIYMPENYKILESDSSARGIPAMLFIHGGGWVTESIDNYDRTCVRMTQELNLPVVSVEYRLAPEHRFPAGLEDCYTVLKRIFEKRFVLNLDSERLVLIGDSAGGNLVAALSLLARDRGEFLPKRQILIYPATDSDHSSNSPYPSVIENGTDFLLTSLKIEQYMELYSSSPSDYKNPYFAPILAEDFSNQPDTLVVSAEYDPLRDEGEAYGRRLADAGNRVRVCRINDALHGFFALGITFSAVTQTMELIRSFLEETE